MDDVHRLDLSTGLRQARHLAAERGVSLEVQADRLITLAYGPGELELHAHASRRFPDAERVLAASDGIMRDYLGLDGRAWGYPEPSRRKLAEWVEWWRAHRDADACGAPSPDPLPDALRASVRPSRLPGAIQAFCTDTLPISIEGDDAVPPEFFTYGSRTDRVTELLWRLNGPTDSDLRRLATGLAALPEAPGASGPLAEKVRIVLRDPAARWSPPRLLGAIEAAAHEIYSHRAGPYLAAIGASLEYAWPIQRWVRVPGWTPPAGHPIGLPAIDYGPNEAPFRRLVDRTARCSTDDVASTANDYAASTLFYILLGSGGHAPRATVWARVSGAVSSQYPAAYKIARGLAAMGLPDQTRAAIKDAAVAVLARGLSDDTDVDAVLEPWRRVRDPQA